MLTRSPYALLPTPPVIYWVQNKQATLNERVVATALEQHNLEFIFQASYFGGRTIRGGQVLDFLVYSPFEIGVQVYGDYWHTGQFSAEDRLKIAVLEQFLGRKLAIVWGNESETVAEASAALRREKVII
jgi:hypothetical protein